MRSSGPRAPRGAGRRRQRFDATEPQRNAIAAAAELGPAAEQPGAVESGYDTDNMVFTKQQADVFRNWALGLGPGDLQRQTMGGRDIVAKVSNVLFINARMARIQRLIATKPDVARQA